MHHYYPHIKYVVKLDLYFSLRKNGFISLDFELSLVDCFGFAEFIFC